VRDEISEFGLRRLLLPLDDHSGVVHLKRYRDTLLCNYVTREITSLEGTQDEAREVI